MFYDIPDDDINKLSIFLKNEFIPNYIKCKIIINKKTLDEEKIYFIDFKDILDLNYSFEQIEFILNYLAEDNIMVISRYGKPYFLDGDFDNCIFAKFSGSLKFPDKLDSYTQRLMFQEYKTTHNKDIRSKLIESNMKLVLSISIEYAKKLNMDVLELNSYGYEGLIIAVDRYDPEIVGNFSTFADKYIRGYILSGIPYIHGFKRGKLYSDFTKARVEVEESHKEFLRDNLYLLDDIINCMIENKSITLRNVNKIRNRILTYLPDDLDKYQNEVTPDIDDSVFYSIFQEEFSKILESALSEKEIMIIKLLFGFSNDSILSYKKVAKICNCSRENIRIIRNEAISKLREPEIISYLSDWFLGFDHSDFDNVKTLNR